MVLPQPGQVLQIQTTQGLPGHVVTLPSLGQERPAPVVPAQTVVPVVLRAHSSDDDVSPGLNRSEYTACITFIWVRSSATGRAWSYLDRGQGDWGDASDAKNVLETAKTAAAYSQIH